MRKLLLALLVAPAVTAGCNFTEFDDLKDQVAVISLDSPSDKATDYGIALQRGRLDSPSGGSVIILGNARIAYTRYDAQADGTLERTASVDMQTVLGSPQQYQPQSQLIADPNGDQVTLVTPTMAANEAAMYVNPSGATISGTNITGIPNLFSATYVNSTLLVSGGQTPETTFITRLPASGATATDRCELQDMAGNAFGTRAMVGQFASNDTSQDLIVFTHDGRLLVFPDTVTTCTGNAIVQASSGDAAPRMFGFTPGPASRMYPLGTEHVVLAALEEGNGSGSSIYVFKVRGTMNGEPEVVGDPKVDQNLRGTAVYESEPGIGYLAAGYPETTRDGVEAAGEIIIYDLSPTGIGNEVARIGRAAPDSGDRLGRAVALFEFNGEPTLAAGGNQHAYIFFSAGAFYSDRRTGRGE